MLAFHPALSEDVTLSKPEGNVILSVEGAISHTNSGDNQMLFDRAMLEQLGMHVLETVTPWNDGVQRYEGPLMRDLLAAVGAKGQEVVVTALNDYSAPVPISDYYTDDVILAIKENGSYMRVRDKGPLFIVYPFDSNPQLNNELTYSRAVWQVKSILVR
ncbi:hypothetical protein CFI10_06320 [Marinobacterium iners]|nr:hypothetical protein CFI10_06320 [Marinobacterium iners]